MTALLASAAVRRPAQRAAGLLTGLMALLAVAPAAMAAEGPYPFLGTWVQASRPCTPTARARTYTPKEVTSPLGRCSIRRVAGNGPTFELLEECRRNDRMGSVTEIIRMTSPDSLTLRRQVLRLKIPRQVHYARCTIAGGSGTPARGAKSTGPHPAPPPAAPAHEIE